MSKYFTPESPEAFVDFPAKREIPTGQVECPVCKGHGGWNLALNCYNLHGAPDTAENRHLRSHFRASCSQCYGWGYTSPENAKCIHTMRHVRNLGRCLNLYECTKCGKKEEVDSSD